MVTDFIIVLLLAVETGFAFAYLVSRLKKYLVLPTAKPKRKRKNDEVARSSGSVLGQSVEDFARQKIARIEASAPHVWQNEAERREFWALYDFLERKTIEGIDD